MTETIRCTVPANTVRIGDRLMSQARQPFVISSPATTWGVTTIRCAGVTIEVPATTPIDVERRSRTIAGDPEDRPREIPKVQHRERIATPDRRVTMPEFTEPQFTGEA